MNQAKYNQNSEIFIENPFKYCGQITKKTGWNHLKNVRLNNRKKKKLRSYSIETCLNVFNGSFIFFIANGDEKRNI